MANDIQITSGAGTVIATDDAGGRHIQLVKLVDGTEDSTARIPGSATLGLTVNTELPAAAALADGASNPTSPLIGSGLLLFNGTTWDRMRGNDGFSALASAARTATTTSADFTNQNARGIVLVLVVSAASGIGGLQLVIQARVNGTGSYTALNATPTAVTTTGTKYYIIYPGAAATNIGSNVVQVVSLPLPRTYRVLVVHGDGSSYTYEIAAAHIL